MPTAVRHSPAAQVLDYVRVTGALLADAHLVISTGQPPHRYLILDIHPPRGLPYHAQVDLGTADADHRATEALLPELRAGAMVSVGGTELRLRTDHGRAALAVLDARHVLLLTDPIATDLFQA